MDAPPKIRHRCGEGATFFFPGLGRRANRAAEKTAAWPLRSVNRVTAAKSPAVIFLDNGQRLGVKLRMFEPK